MKKNNIEGFFMDGVHSDICANGANIKQIFTWITKTRC